MEISPQVFKKSIRGHLETDPELKEDLAKHFEVSVSTVERWANGVACPLPPIRLQVLQYIGSKFGE